MQPRYWASLAALALLAAGSKAFAEIREWSGATGGYTINQQRREILITIPGVYKFESITNGEPDDINLIETLLDFGQGNGPFEATVHIGRDPNFGSGAGCRDLGSVVQGEGFPVNLGDCNIGRNLSKAPFAVSIQKVTGVMHVAGGVPSLMAIGASIEAPITIEEYVTALEVYSEGQVDAPVV